MVADIAVTDIMTADVIAVPTTADVVEVARLMVQHDITGVPVVEGGRVVGLITDADMVSREIDVDPPAYGTFLDAIFRLPWDKSDEELRHVLATTAGELMSKPAITIRSSASVRDAANLMYKRGVNPLPVLDDTGRMVGIISRSDIIRLIAEV
jgi:CBS domain-containing protein